MSTTFEISEDHISALRHLEFDWNSWIEFGGVCSDFKRPFGNSDVLTDIQEILGTNRCYVRFGAEEPSWEEAQRFVAELAAVVNCIIQTSINGMCDTNDLIGTEIDYTWRANKEFNR